MDTDMDKQSRKRSYPVHKPPERFEDDCSNIQGVVDRVFEKSFELHNVGNFSLPEPQSMFTKDPWLIEELQELKVELNSVKSKLNDYCLSHWHQHTSRRNKAKDIEWRVRRQFDPEFVTQAWCKFHEIISKYPLVPRENISIDSNKFTSVHLCEAPGAFITCLNHWLKTNAPMIDWDWMAMTLNPYYEGNSISDMISDDRFIISTLDNWYFGEDCTGNLMTLDNLDGIIQRARLKGKISLVTADGSVNCSSNPGEQEVTVVNLHFCEIVAAMHILETDGNLLLKIFTVFEYHSINLIYLLSCSFKKIHFYKPVTSKEGNSEMYVICTGFKGYDFISPYLPILRQHYADSSSAAMFRRHQIPQNFIDQMTACARLFKNFQVEVIESNIAAYKCDDNDFTLTFKEKQILKLVADKYISEFPIVRLHPDLQIVGNSKLKRNKKNHWIVESPSESFSEKQMKESMQPMEKILMLKDKLQASRFSSQTFVLHPPNQCYEPLVVMGKFYRRIQNSRFCTVQISRVYHLIFQIIDEHLGCDIPSAQDIDMFESQDMRAWKDCYKILKFQFTQVWDNSQTIALVNQTLTDFQEGHNLVLLGFLLLTHFNIGLIHALSHCFKSVEIITDEKIGYYILLKSFIPKKHVLQKIQNIANIAKEAKNEATILSITPISELHGSKNYPIVVRLNHWIAKYCVDSLSSSQSGKTIRPESQ